MSPAHSLSSLLLDTLYLIVKSEDDMFCIISSSYIFLPHLQFVCLLCNSLPYQYFSNLNIFQSSFLVVVIIGQVILSMSIDDNMQ